MKTNNKEWREQNEELPLILRWGIYYLKHRYPNGFEPMHVEIGEAIQNNKRVAIAAPRGHGKSTIAHLNAALYYALEEVQPHGVLILDDMEDDESVSSELQRKKVTRYYQHTLLGFRHCFCAGAHPTTEVLHRLVTCALAKRDGH